MPSNLASVLSRIGKPFEQYPNPDGSRLLLLLYGARVLGLFAPGSDQNFFWTHPALNSSASAAAFYQSVGWHNSGGDRTWLAPEVDVCFPNFPDTSSYWVPAEVDPGNYALMRVGESVRFISQFTLTLSRSRVKICARISKSWEPALNPLRYEPVWDALQGVAYAGYTQHTSLELLNEGMTTSAQVGLWNLVALPHGGEVIISTFLKAEPKIYSGPIDPDNIIVTDHLVRYRVRGKGIQKIGIRAVASTGRMGYLYPNSEAWALVVRNFAVNPSGEYIDVPLEEPTSRPELTFPTQACSVNSELGAYCELEYHAPAIGFGTGPLRCDDTSQVWAFRGSRHAIQQVVSNLLFAPLARAAHPDAACFPCSPTPGEG